MVEVVQADREAFAAMCDIQGGPNVMPSYVRMGQADHHPGVQAFAKHRLAHLTPNTDLSDAQRDEVIEECAQWLIDNHFMVAVANQLRNLKSQDGPR